MFYNNITYIGSDGIRAGLIGKGFVGSALYDSFTSRGQHVEVYDKFKGIGKLEDLVKSDIIFLCLPTPYIEGHGYDIGPIYETCKKLQELNYHGFVVLKSTVEPGITNKLQKIFDPMIFCHNPEFLTARTAFQDFDTQKYIILGSSEKYKLSEGTMIYHLYKNIFPEAQIKFCTSDESESTKIFVNSFYSVKVQFFTELYLLCQKLGIDFENVKGMMLDLGWINPMHTMVPGPDGQISYGGACYPKDSNALKQLMETSGSPNAILNASITERNKMRKD